MSSTGATLSGSFSGETGIISETGFYYGTTSGSLGNKISTGSTSSPFSTSISGLAPGTTCYYKAYVVDYNASTLSTEERLGAIQSFTTNKVATATVTTSEASDIAQTTAVLHGSYLGASGAVDYAGFLWGTSSSSCTTELFASSSSTPFSATLTGLEEGHTYYFKAFVDEYNENTKSYERRVGSVQSVTTLSASSLAPGYLSCYEVPDVSGIYNGSGTSGYNSDRRDKWYRYYTNSNKRQIAVHSFQQASAVDSNTPWTRNYTVLYDGDNYAPLWVAYAMHTDTWRKILSGRDGSWGSDPAISLTQQTGLNNAQSVGYSRGHMVASQERQTTSYQNDQTFYYSNQAPQWQNGFNGGVWATMEGDLVSNAPSGRDTLYVVTGVLYEGNVSTLPSTSNNTTLNVPIPSHFYKCLMMCSFDTSGEMTKATGIAILMTNEAHNGANYTDSEFITSIDEIETRTGFEFFPRVPSSLQTTAEANTSWNVFKNKANIKYVTNVKWGIL